jgi:hypothetical protein
MGATAASEGMAGESRRQQLQVLALAAAPQLWQHMFLGLMPASRTHTPASIWVARMVIAMHRRMEALFRPSVPLFFVARQRARYYL